MNRILITGGAGFIGSNLARHLIEKGHEITIIDNLSTGSYSNIRNIAKDTNFRFVEGDVRDLNLVQDCVKGTDSVVHLAAVTSVPYSLDKPQETFDVNLNGTVNLLRCSLENHVSKFIYGSSCAVYGDVLRLPIREDHSLQALSPYAASKIEAEQQCRAFSEKGLHTVSLRFFNVYGPGQEFSTNHGVISNFIEKMMRRQAPLIYGDGEQIRDFVHVNDIVEVLTKLIEDANGDSTALNIGTGKATSINQLVMDLQELLDREELTPLRQPPRPGDIRLSQADIGRAKHLLSYLPHIDLPRGLEMLLANRNLA